jgi:hypothetical protein
MCRVPPPAPPELVSKARKLARSLGSAEAAYARLKAEGHDVSARGVRNWIAKGATAKRAAPKVANAPDPAPATQPLVKVKRPLAASASAAQVPPCAVPTPEASKPKRRAGSELPDELRGIDVEALGWEALKLLAIAARRFRDKAEADDAPKVFVELVRLEMDVHDRIERLRPPEPVDPETDPGNLAAGELLMRRLDGLISAAEAKAGPAP